MSMADVRSSEAGTRGKAGTVDLKLEVVVIPVADADRAKAFYAGLGMAARRRLRVRQRVPGHPVHAARLGGLGPVRYEDHVGPARLGRGPLPDRVRHPGRAGRARGARRRGQRGVPRGNAGRSVPPGGRGWARQRARARSLQLRVVRDVQRPGRQRLAAAGGHDPAAGPHRRPRRPSPLRPTSRTRSAGRRPPTASTRSAPARRDEEWPAWYAAYIVAEQAGTELPT